MFEMFYFEEEVKKSDINKMFYDDFLKHQIILYVKSSMSKKQLLKFKNKIKQKSFYPVHIIYESNHDTEISKRGKLKQAQQKNESFFLRRYKQVAQNQFHTDSLFTIVDQIKVCPFCKKNSVKIFHSYTGKYDAYFFSLFVECDNCKKTFEKKTLCGGLNYYVKYNSTLKHYLDEYCMNYGDAKLLQKIIEQIDISKIRTFDPYSSIRAINYEAIERI